MAEDGADASFAGQHLTLLNVPESGDLTSALREVWWSANSDSAITYRQRVGLYARPSVGVVVLADELRHDALVKLDAGVHRAVYDLRRIVGVVAVEGVLGQLAPVAIRRSLVLRLLRGSRRRLPLLDLLRRRGGEVDLVRLGDFDLDRLIRPAA